jgi:hypothetical protein
MPRPGLNHQDPGSTDAAHMRARHASLLQPPRNIYHRGHLPTYQISLEQRGALYSPIAPHGQQRLYV